MYYSDEIVEEVRAGNDIVDVIGSYIKLQKKGANYMGLCPFHGEKTASFSVSGSRQMYHCFGCGVGGNVFTFLMEYENFSFPEAIQQCQTQNQKQTAQQREHQTNDPRCADAFFHRISLSSCACGRC